MARQSSSPWVGRPLLRVEDDALLRGEGRFLDDLSPVAHSYHAAVVRSQLAHARIAVDASAALEAPGVIGVLTGADVTALSRPFPAGIDSGTPQYATAIDTVRYVGEPIAVVVARDRYLAEDAAELVDVDYDPLDAVLDPVAQLRTRCTSGCSSTATSTRAMARGRSRLAPDVPRPPLHLHARGVLCRRGRLGRGGRAPDGVGELPGAVHAARRRGGGARAEGRPAPAAHAPRLGRLVRHQVVRVHLHRADGPRITPSGRARDVDRGQARASRLECRSHGAHDRGRGGLHGGRSARRAPLRRDRGRRRVRPRARARNALPDAWVALGRVHGCRTSPCATGSCSRTPSRRA